MVKAIIDWCLSEAFVQLGFQKERQKVFARNEV